MKFGVFLLALGIMTLISGICIAPILAVLIVILNIGTGVHFNSSVDFNRIWKTVGAALAISLPLGGVLIYLGRHYLEKKR